MSSRTNRFINLRLPKASVLVRAITVVLMVGFGIWFTSKALGGFITEFMAGRRFLIEFLVIFIVTGYFPLTYIAYQSFRQPIRMIRLRADFKRLGYQEEEADRLYKPSQDPWSYGLYIALAMLLTIIGMGIFFWPLSSSTTVSGFFLPSLNSVTVNDWIDPKTFNALRYGFLGAYVFSAYLIYRRYTTDDLQPTVYLYTALTMIAGFVFNYVAFEALFKLTQADDVSTTTGIQGGLFSILAFALGYFPNLAVRWFNQIAYSALKVDPRHSEALPLSLIDGISQWHEARLRDNGIDNIQNLAAVEIRDLLVSTTFDAQQVVDWVDQAILYLYLDQSEIASFRRAGIRLISDLHKLCDTTNCGDATQAEEAINNLAKQLQVTPERLEMLRNATQSGPNLHRVLNYWSLAKMQSRQLQDKVIDEFEVLDQLVEKARDPGVELQPNVATLLSGIGDLLSDAIENPRPHVRVAIGNLYALCAGKNYRVTEYRLKALKCYTRTIEDKSDYARAYSQRAMIYDYSDEPLLAMEDYKKAVELNPDHFPRNYNNLAYIYAHECKPPRLDEALAQATRAVQISKRDKEESDPAYLDTLAGVQLMLAEKEPDSAKKLDLLNQAYDNLRRIQFGPHIPDHGRKEIVRNEEKLFQLYVQVLQCEQGTEIRGEMAQHMENMIDKWLKLAELKPFDAAQKRWDETQERVNKEMKAFKDFKQLTLDTSTRALLQIQNLPCWPEDHRPKLETFSKAVGALKSGADNH